MAGYCTVAQVKLAYNTNEIDDLGDDDANGSADTGVIEDAIYRASRAIWSAIAPRYYSVTTMNPESYSTGAYPVLDSMTATLAADYMRERQGGEPVANDHPALTWARRVALGVERIMAAS